MDFGDDDIRGIDTDPLICDALMQRRRSDWTQHERALFTGKWFAYRFLHPVQATYVYAHEFEKAYRRYYREAFDASRAEHIRVFPTADVFLVDDPNAFAAALAEGWSAPTGIFDPKKIEIRRAKAVKDGSKRAQSVLSGLWRGRMCADALCMPYSVYIDLAFSLALRGWEQKYMPQPTHLNSDRITDRIGQEWEKRQETRLYFSEQAAFHNDFYRGLRVQNDHHEWIMGQAEKRMDCVRILGDFVHRRKLLPMNKVEVRFSRDLSDQVQALAA